MTRKPRFSRQRSTILSIIESDGGHLPADEIFSRAKRKIPAISRGTVYRNLAQLEEMQAITKTQGQNQIAYFEPYAKPHHHFICESCNSIIDLDSPTVKLCHSCVTDSSKLPFNIKSSIMTLYGECGHCVEKQVDAPLIKITEHTSV